MKRLYSILLAVSLGLSFGVSSVNACSCDYLLKYCLNGDKQACYDYKRYCAEYRP